MKWGVVIIIIANYLIPYVFQLHIKYYRQMESFCFVHTGKDRHHHWSSGDLQAALLITTHTTPDHRLHLRYSPLSSPGVMRITICNIQVIQICIASVLDSWGQKAGKCGPGRVRVPWWVSWRLLSSPCPRGAVESLALTHQAAPLCCLPGYCHLLTSPVLWQTP